MRVVALISGGKDSCYNMMQCVSEGHEIVALANLRPKDVDEMDSYMFQTVGHHAIDLYAQAMDLPLYRRLITRTARNTQNDYEVDELDEVEDLFELLQDVKVNHSVEGVAVGAILSNYQRVRVENVCSRLGLTALSFLWRRDQVELMKEMIESKVHAIVIKVAALGLMPVDLGKTLEEMYPKLLKLSKEYGINVCGEGGEYETFTLDCPLFNKRLVVDEKEIVMHTDTPYAPVAYINFSKLHLEDTNLSHIAREDRLRGLPMKTSRNCLTDLQMNEFSSADIVHAQQSKCDQSLENMTVTKCEKSPDLWLAGLTDLHAKNLKSAVKNVMEQLGELLQSHGLGFSDVCVVHLYVQDMDNFTDINQVYKQYFSLNPPVRVCVEADLCGNQPILVDCYARAQNVAAEYQDLVHTMHVQGVSHWAPANIGPYSQCKRVGKQLYVAGQIPLVPGSMKIIEDSVGAQCRLALHHVNKVVQAMTNEQATVENVSSIICYVTNAQFVETAKFELARVCSNCTVVYIVIPMLPRNAAVEWEAIARTDKKDLVYKRSEIHIGGYSVKLELCTLEKTLINNHILISKNGCESARDVLNELEHIFEYCFDGVVSPHGVIRVFFRSKDFKVCELQAKVAESLHLLHIQLAIAVVPVHGFVHEDGLIALLVL